MSFICRLATATIDSTLTVVNIISGIVFISDSFADTKIEFLEFTETYFDKGKFTHFTMKN
jgi:hypothetical protein